ncbi:hypothetical protein [Adhaeribacter swui]|nr:hypothetical protein [Adhaeribacter swui]
MWQYWVVGFILLNWVGWVAYHWLKPQWMPKLNKRRKYRGI